MMQCNVMPILHDDVTMLLAHTTNAPVSGHEAHRSVHLTVSTNLCPTEHEHRSDAMPDYNGSHLPCAPMHECTPGAIHEGGSAQLMPSHVLLGPNKLTGNKRLNTHNTTTQRSPKAQAQLNTHPMTTTKKATASPHNKAKPTATDATQFYERVHMLRMSVLLQSVSSRRCNTKTQAFMPLDTILNSPHTLVEHTSMYS